jgi:hypothetical protein
LAVEAVRRGRMAARLGVQRAATGNDPTGDLDGQMPGTKVVDRVHRFAVVRSRRMRAMVWARVFLPDLQECRRSGTTFP